MLSSNPERIDVKTRARKSIGGYPQRLPKDHQRLQKEDSFPVAVETSIDLQRKNNKPCWDGSILLNIEKTKTNLTPALLKSKGFPDDIYFKQLYLKEKQKVKELEQTVKDLKLLIGLE